MLLPEDPEWKCWAEGLRADREEVLPVDCMCARGRIIMRTLTKDSTDWGRRFYFEGDAGDQESTGTAKGRRRDAGITMREACVRDSEGQKRLGS